MLVWLIWPEQDDKRVHEKIIANRLNMILFFFENIHFFISTFVYNNILVTDFFVSPAIKNVDPIGNGATEILKCDHVGYGRYMVIYIVGNDRLTLCEVQIFTDGNRYVSFNFNILDGVLNHHL